MQASAKSATALHIQSRAQSKSKQRARRSTLQNLSKLTDLDHYKVFQIDTEADSCQPTQMATSACRAAVFECRSLLDRLCESCAFVLGYHTVFHTLALALLNRRVQACTRVLLDAIR